MKKAILIYCTIIYALIFILTVLSFNRIGYEIVFLSIVSAIALVAIYNVFRNKNLSISLGALMLIHLFQSVTFILDGVLYKFIVGTNINFQLVNNGDVKTRLSFLPLDFGFSITTIQDQGFMLGVNVTQLFLFIYFTKWLNQIEKLKE